MTSVMDILVGSNENLQDENLNIENEVQQPSEEHGTLFDLSKEDEDMESPENEYYKPIVIENSKPLKKRRREQVTMNIAPLSTGPTFDSTPGEEMDDDELLEDGSLDEISDEDPDDEADQPFRIPVMDPSEPRFCFCRWGESGAMVQCSGCKEWFHDECIGLVEQEIENIITYYCAVCCAKDKKHVTTYKRDPAVLRRIVNKKVKRNIISQRPFPTGSRMMVNVRNIRPVKFRKPQDIYQQEYREENAERLLVNRAQKRKRQIERKIKKEMKLKYEMTKEDHRMVKKNFMIAEQRDEPGEIYEEYECDLTKIESQYYEEEEEEEEEVEEEVVEEDGVVKMERLEFTVDGEEGQDGANSALEEGGTNIVNEVEEEVEGETEEEEERIIATIIEEDIAPGSGDNWRYGYKKRKRQPKAAPKPPKVKVPKPPKVKKEPVAFVMCEECGDAFKTEKARDRHFKSKHAVKQVVMYECDECQKRYQTKAGLQDHITKLHRSKETFACMFCGDNFTSMNKLTAHTNSRHLNVRMSCEICSRSYSNRSALASHMRKSHGEGAGESEEGDQD